MAVKLKWQPRVLGDGQRIYRSATPFTTDTLPPVLATVDAGANEFLDEAPFGGDNYYRVEAFTSTPAQSAFSGMVLAKADGGSGPVGPLPFPRIPVLADFPNFFDGSAGAFTPSEDATGVHISGNTSSASNLVYILYRDYLLVDDGQYMQGHLNWTMPSTNYRSVRLAFKKSNGSWVTFGPTYDSGYKISVTEFSALFGFESHSYAPSATHYGKEHFRVIKVAGDIQFQASSDGVTWATLLTKSYDIIGGGFLLDSSTNSDGGVDKSNSLLWWDEA